MAEQNQEANALLELERRAMMGDPSITPEVKTKIDEKLRAYRQQGLVKPLGGTKVLSSADRKQMETGIDSYAALKNARGSFTDDFAGNTITGGLENLAQSVSAGIGTPGQRDWWSNFRATDNQIRNELFGSALTDTEKRAYEETTISERMDPKIIRQNLERRAEIIREALSRRTDYFKKAGYDAEAIDALTGQYGADFSPDYKPQSPSTEAPDQKKQEMLGTLVPLDVAKKLEEGGLPPEQQAAYDAFNKANPNATADQLRAFASSIGMADLENAEAIVKARDEGGGLPAAEGGKIRPPDISDVRGKDDFYEGADAAVRGAADTLSLGFADEISAAGKTLFNGGTMDDNLRRERAIDAYDAENSPWLRGAGQLAGGLLFPVGRGATAPGELAKIGGLTGAGYGFGSGETMGERVGGAALGGPSGAALGFGAGKLFEKLRPIGGGSPGGNKAVDTARDVSEASADLGIDMLPSDAGGALTRGLTTMTRSTPGGIVPITRAAQRSQRQAGDALGRIASREGEAMDAEAMGEAVREGALKFRTGSRNNIGRVYEKAAEEAGDAKIAPVSALATLDRNIAELSEVPGGADGLAILQALKTELAQRGTVTVNGIRGMRTQLRQKFAKDNLRGSDIERRVNEVVDAASNDLITSLEAQGKTNAARTYAEADRQWAERIKTLDDVIMPIIGKKGEKSGEQIASALNAAAKGNNARLAKLFETLPEEEAGIARATMIDNLGKASAGAQNAAGDEFSFNTFLTNWNKMGNSAKNAIFQGENRKAIDQLALIAEQSKAASKYQNYSGTASPVIGAMTAGTAFASFATLGKVLAAQYGMGVLLASPRVAKGLLKIAQAKNPAAAKARIDALSSVAAREPVLSAEISQLQQKLMSAMNDNMPAQSAASEGQQEKKGR